MADELDVLLDKVDDQALRAELRAHVDRLRARRSFGLVFEDHIPERVNLPDHPIRRGVRVVRRDEQGGEALEVQSIRRGEATVVGRDGATATLPVGELVVVAEFGQTIHPGLQRLGSIDRGGDKPAHVVINAENHHALEMLQYTHAGKIDCIYIDPPYNTGARDWKYDNDYVDADDAYRHSKWLAFMQRRLKLAKQLLNPENSVLIVTIDEKEYLRLGLLLEQLFAGARTQMVSSVINPKGTGRTNEFARVNEFIYFVRLGGATLVPMNDKGKGSRLDWQTFRRRDLSSVRHTRPAQFYPIYVNTETGLIEALGEPLKAGDSRHDVPSRPGCVAVFPVRPDGTEMNWAVTAPSFAARLERGYARAGKFTEGAPQPYAIQYLKSGPIADLEAGRASVTGRNADGSVIAEYVSDRARLPSTQWSLPSHNAEHSGTGVLKALLPGRRFPFPKSLYAVEDALRFYVASKPDAVILDFFAGSGTTAHAVARLNRQDGGRRQTILVTNNEVSADEAKALAAQGHRDGDPEWEALGIYEHITRPRITAAITGHTPDGEPVKGGYKFVDEFPMADGFAENVEFMRLTYLDPLAVELDEAFEAVAPLLWLRAGGQGPVIESRADGFAVTERYGILFDPDRWRPFVDGLPDSAATVFVVTDSPSIFAGIVAELPTHVDAVRLYESYLQSFAFNQGR